MFNTIAEIITANENRGDCWFSEDTMKFFKSRVVSEVHKGRYFVTSEKGPHDTKPLFTVRMTSDDGDIRNASKFQEFKSLPGALGFIKHLN